MAGRNHHHIPQLIQRGFSAGTTPSGYSQVLVFRKGRTPYLAGTENTFVIRDFYGKPDDPELDDTLTEAEIRLESFVQNARCWSALTSLGRSESAAELLHQLSIRVRWIREFASRTFSVAADHVGKKTSSVDGRVALLVAHCKKEKSFLADELQKYLEKRSGRKLTRNERRAAKLLANRLIASPKALAAHMDGPNPLPIEALTASIPAAAESAHRRGLRSALDKPNIFRDYFISLSWSVTHSSDRLISGDCGPLYFDAHGAVLGPMGAGHRDKSTGVLLPISTHHVLFGTTGSDCTCPAVYEINRAAAGWSHEAFIASFNTKETEELHGSIGGLMEAWLAAQQLDLD